ncbi:olfactory receptor 52K2-like [Dunckerocampus dactyliophorus]|uniref:olfactory receptor 52K2-like n=1 Tax=Dunckerocampus dactyliophorus TaxID=161453 RepID=UPI002406D4D9|nr:olfactory receptor 52K2-like [Dunckerocampus dactyliophorus]
MEDPHNVSSALTLDSFNIAPEGVVPAFLFASLSYTIILFCNLILILTIVLNKHLHQPKNLFLLNMPINDLIGSSAFFLQLIKEMVTSSRSIEYLPCVAQAFFIHIYAAATVLILTAMAYDRYVAICLPLKYNSIMTHAHMMKIIGAVWVGCLLMIGVLFYLLLRLPRCRSKMAQLYCDNPSLLSLVCASTAVNNIFGLCIVAFTQVLANGMILYTYLHILVACFQSKRSDTKAKALQTCATHLFVFLLLECLGLFTIISYRVKHIPPNFRRFMGSSTLIFPPTLNPIVYGLKTQEIRENIMHFFRAATSSRSSNRALAPSH